MKGYLYKVLPMTTVGRKLTMAVTGILLIGFLVFHLAANLLLFVDREGYNIYSHALVSHPLIYLAEVGLLALFVFHIFDALILRVTERKARPIPYDTTRSHGRRTVYSYTMIWSGLAILVFVVVHVWTMKFQPKAQIELAGNLMADLSSHVLHKFQSSAGFSIFYMVMMIVLGFHLAHACISSLRTIGITHRRYLAFLKSLSYLFAFLVALGFFSIPFYFWLFYKG